jgi:hypothetical protein
VDVGMGMLSLAVGALALGVQVSLPIRMVLSAVALPLGWKFLRLCLILFDIVQTTR